MYGPISHIIVHVYEYVFMYVYTYLYMKWIFIRIYVWKIFYRGLIWLFWSFEGKNI